MLNIRYPGLAEGYNQNKASQQVNRPSGPKAHPKHIAALAAAAKRMRVRVEPTNEDNRHILTHPNGMAFRKTGSVEWPMDRFTQRRLRDGSIKIVEEVVGQKRTPVAATPEQHTRHGHRQHSEEASSETAK